MEERFQDWCAPEIKHGVPTKYGWIVAHPESLILGFGTDIGAFCYLQAEAGIDIGRHVQLGSGCRIYSVSSIDNKRGTVTLGDNCKIGANSVIMPGTIVGENSMIGALSFVQANTHIPPDEMWAGIPAKKKGGITNASTVL